MKQKNLPRPGAALAVLLLAVAPPALAELSVQAGVDYTSGEYGAAEDTRILYIPISLKTESEHYFARVTVPYIEVDAPSGGGDVVFVDGTPIVTAGGDRAKDDGLGDVVATLGYTAFNSYSSGTIVDVVGKVKFGTADEDKGLGSGEDDYSIQIDGYKSFNRLTFLLTAGHRVYGDPAGFEFNDVFFGSVGAVYKFQSSTSGGVVYDFREKIIADGDEQSEVTAFVTRKISGKRKIQGYVVGGLSDASPDWGAGAVLTQGF